MAKVQADSQAADRLLAAFWDGDESEEHTVIPASALARPEEDDQGDADEVSVLEPEVAALLAELVERRTWPRGEAKDRARARGLMLDAALAAINEFAVEQCDTELVEAEGDLLTIDSEVLEELDLSALPSAEGKPQPTQSPSPDRSTASRSESPAPTRTTRTHAPRWVSRVEVIRVHGRSISGGMFYYGTPEEGEGRGEVVDPSLYMGETGGVASGTPGPGEIRDYADLSPNARAALLDWLAGGRRSPSAQENSLFLFLRGLERRVLVDLRRGSDHGEQLREILAEVRRLTKDYVYVRRFHTRALAFQDVLERLSMDAQAKRSPSFTHEPSADLPHLLRFEIGYVARGNNRIPATWALAWAVHDPRIRPESRLRLSVKFHAAFRKHFQDRFPQGMRLPSDLADLRWIYRPSNPELPEFSVPTAGAKDVCEHLPAIQALQQIIRAAVAACAALPGATAVAQKDSGKAKAPDARTAASPTTLERTPAPVPKRVPDTSEYVPVPASLTATSAPTTDKPPVRRWSTWNAPGTQVVVGATVIPGGMLYTGYGIDSPNTGPDFQVASAIDVSLRVQHSVTTPECEIAGPVTGYPDLTPEQRGRYLLWLQDRSQKESIPLAFPRLFVQGIERRIVELVRNAENGRAHITDLLLEELERLLVTFGGSPEFTGYARGLLSLVRGAMGKAKPVSGPPPRYRDGVGKPSFEFLRGLGTMVRDKAPLPAEWALEWIAHHLRPQNPEAFRGHARARLAWTSLPRRMDLVVPDSLPELVLPYQPGCPGLEKVEVPLRGVKDLTGVAPPDALLDRVRGLAAEPARRQQPVPSSAETPKAPQRRQESQPSNAHALAWARLALETARHSGEATADHRLAIMRGTEELAGLDLYGQRLLGVHAMEREQGREPAALVQALVDLSLRRRERAGDFLLDVLDAGGPPSPDQVEFLLAVHQGLGLEAVLRLRLSYRGIAPVPDPSGSGSFGAARDPQRSVRNREAPFRRVRSLPDTYARLLADLRTRPEWGNADFARLAAWYGVSKIETVYTLNRAARSLAKADVLDEQGDTIVVHTERAEEMTA
ncbi:hypothetical protein HNR06_000043 [Nocardiopsis arvandica]|uniref:TerB N-terminal domain-containing protein n=1 Tax=Nocardiopsis sinuspersici TaxID=501010 RepID=A0A7Y9X748_9ACTN|nr:hypothetical protein [Nocardiopsis sinuspersici]